MHAYVGKNCPFCNTSFKDGDDIVICSDCDMPHHKDCWIENCGCTTFGCNGTISAVSERLTSVTSTELDFEETDPQNTSEDYGVLIGKGQGYYLKCFEKLKCNKSVISWNWFAFVSPPIWLIYRKLYFAGAVLFRCEFIAAFMPIPLFISFSIVISILAALFSNYLYMRKLDMQMNKVADLGDCERYSFLFKKSGVDLIAAVLSSFVYLVIAIIICLGVFL